MLVGIAPIVVAVIWIIGLIYAGFAINAAAIFSCSIIFFMLVLAVASHRYKVLTRRM